MNKRTIYISLMFFLAIGVVKAQDVHYSQFYVNTIALNPAQAGMFDGNVRAIVNYKDQYRSIASPYKTFSLAVDKAFMQSNKSMNVGTGIILNRDVAGDLNYGTFDAAGLLSGIVMLNDNMKASGGIQVGYKQRSVNSEKMEWADQITPYGYDQNIAHGDQTNDFSSHSMLDVSAGIAFSFKTTQSRMSANDAIIVNAGAAIYHFNKPSKTFYGSTESLSPKLIANLDGLIPLEGTNISILPSALFAFQGKSNEIIAGTLIKYQIKEGSKYTGFEKESAISVGGHYRVGDALIISALLEMAYFGIGLSYDVNLSGLTAATKSRGGFEFSFRYIIPKATVYGKSRV
jgi:type IX secretion system PorP/SprF family membrane protein